MEPSQLLPKFKIQLCCVWWPPNMTMLVGRTALGNVHIIKGHCISWIHQHMDAHTVHLQGYDILVGGFNVLKNINQIGSFPQVEMKKKTISKTTTQIYNGILRNAPLMSSWDPKPKCQGARWEAFHASCFVDACIKLQITSLNIKRNIQQTYTRYFMQVGTLRIHVWYIYLHLLDFYGFHVGKYTSPMDPLGYTVLFLHEFWVWNFYC